MAAWTAGRTDLADPSRALPDYLPSLQEIPIACNCGALYRSDLGFPVLLTHCHQCGGREHTIPERPWLGNHPQWALDLAETLAIMLTKNTPEYTKWAQEILQKLEKGLS